MEPVYAKIMDLNVQVVAIDPKKNGDDYILTSQQYNLVSAFVSELIYYVETQYARCAETPPTPRAL